MPLFERREDGVAWLGQFKTRAGWAAAIAAVNLVGIAYGFYYYAPQFARTPAWLWPFVPDSPLAVLWAELALVAWWLRRRVGVLDALAVVGNLQIMAWTTYVFLAFPSLDALLFLEGGPVTLNTVLLVAHLAMAALALVFANGLRRLRAERPRAFWLAAGGALAYYVVQDALDYFGPDFVGRGCGMRPYTIPCGEATEPWLAAVTFGITLASALVLVLVTRPRAARAGAAATAAEA